MLLWDSHLLAFCCCSCDPDAEQRSRATHVADDDGGDLGSVGVQRHRRLPYLLQRVGAAVRHGPVAYRRRRTVHGCRGVRSRAALRLRRPSARQVRRRRSTQQLLRHRLHQQTKPGSAAVLPTRLYLFIRKKQAVVRGTTNPAPCCHLANDTDLLTPAVAGDNKQIDL